jgi:hypothetical protein
MVAAAGSRHAHAVSFEMALVASLFAIGCSAVATGCLATAWAIWQYLGDSQQIVLTALAAR